jgi:hypothetical protein
MSHEKIKEALTIKNKGIQQLFDVSPVMIFYKDLDGKIYMVNKAVADLFGKTKKQIEGKHTSSFFPKEDAQRLCKQDQEVIRTGKPKTGLLNYVVGHKTSKWLKVSKIPLRDHNNTLTGIACIAEDVTDMIAVEEKLRKDELEKEAILNSTVELITYQSKKLQIIWANDAACQSAGIKREKLIGRYCYSVWPKRKSICPDCPVKKAMDTGKPQSVEKSTPDGRIWHIKGYPVKDAAGKVTGGIEVTLETTEQKKAEQELLQSRKRYQALFDNSPVPIWEEDLSELYEYLDQLRKKGVKDFRSYFTIHAAALQTCTRKVIIDDVNKAVLKLFGTGKKSELLGPVEKVLDNDSLQAFKEQVIAIARGKKEFATEVRMQASKGPLYFLLRMIIDKEQIGRKRGLLVTINITGLKEAQETLHQKNVELNLARIKAEESDRLKTAFLANISHEIRTPMNGIIGFANFLQDSQITQDEQNKYLAIIEKSGHRMLNIINDLIDISRIEAGQVETTFSKCNINEKMEYLYYFFIPEAEKKGISLTYHTVLSDDKAFFVTDKDKLLAVMSNLLKNAIKYTRKGCVEFGYTTGKDSIEFYVIDTGIGISQAKKKVIFDRFVQADLSINKPYEGAGLGLSISQAYVEMLGGKIQVRSQKGRGSKFYFSLPEKKKVDMKSEADNNHALPSSSTIQKGRKPVVLITEDDETSDVYLTRLLKGRCDKVLHARDGNEAIELCRKNKDIDIVLMDIKLPVMDGYTATKKIREFNKEVIIIAQTAFALSGDREKALDAGCDDYIPKPIDGDLFYEILDKNIQKL